MTQQPNDRTDLLLGGLGSLVVNLGFLLAAAGDQRILLLLFASIIAGGVMIFTERGGIGMGIILGAVVAVIAALVIAGIFDWSPIRG
ncbi:MAG: hypothetical protein JWQ74_285 [Marmoricola sp.]|nr:hypothetical protein [Marmoricola sp.]